MALEYSSVLDDVLDKFSKMTKSEFKEALRLARKKKARKLLEEKPMFIEFTDKCNEKRQCVRLRLTSLYAVKDPEQNYCVLRYAGKTELIEMIAQGTGDFYSLK